MAVTGNGKTIQQPEPEGRHLARFVGFPFSGIEVRAVKSVCVSAPPPYTGSLIRPCGPCSRSRRDVWPENASS